MQAAVDEKKLLLKEHIKQVNRVPQHVPQSGPQSGPHNTRIKATGFWPPVGFEISSFRNPHIAARIARLPRINTSVLAVPMSREPSQGTSTRRTMSAPLPPRKKAPGNVRTPLTAPLFSHGITSSGGRDAPTQPQAKRLIPETQKSKKLFGVLPRRSPTLGDTRKAPAPRVVPASREPAPPKGKTLPPHPLASQQAGRNINPQNASGSKSHAPSSFPVSNEERGVGGKYKANGYK